MSQLVEIARRNAEFWRSRSGELRKYVGSFVAIFNGEIVGADKDYMSLLESLKRKGIDPRLVEIEYVPSEEYILVI